MSGTNGKGSRRRPAAVSEEELAARWDAVFGRKDRLPPFADIEEGPLEYDWALPTAEQMERAIDEECRQIARQRGWDDCAADRAYQPPADSETAMEYQAGWMQAAHGEERPQ